MERGYKIAPFYSNYGGLKQRWLLVYSEQAYERERKTLEKSLAAKDEILRKQLWHPGNELFSCEKDARSALKGIEKKNRLYKIRDQITAVMKYARQGKPKIGEEKVLVGFKIESDFERNTEEIEQLLNKKGRFILATNDLDIDKEMTANINEIRKQIIRLFGETACEIYGLIQKKSIKDSSQNSKSFNQYQVHLRSQ